jgi:hypothetical protein
MQGKHVFFSVHVPGTLTADITPIFKAPFPLQLVAVSACSTVATNATIKIGTMADDDAYMAATAIANSGSAAGFGRTDFVDDQYPHISKDTQVKVTVDFDGSSGSAAANLQVLLDFVEG